MFDGITFLHPWFFLLLLVIPLYLGWYFWRRRTADATLQVSTTSTLTGAPKTWRVRLRLLPLALRLVAIALIVVVLARPQSTSSHTDENSHTEGIDIMLSIDVSTSMLAIDFKPNRLVVAKNVAQEFVRSRRNDNIGFVVFAGESFTRCPLTLDHSVLVNTLESVKAGEDLEPGTAIGMGLAAAVSRIKDSKAESKVIILLTDGENNCGTISPEKAADLAKTYGIRLYTVGVGSRGMTKIPVQTHFGTQWQDMETRIDEQQLTSMAERTGGKYFRAQNTDALKEVYAEIDKMEKTILEVKQYTTRKEEFLPFALAAMFLLLAEALLRNTLLRTIP